jgi:hypothetical protein
MIHMFVYILRHGTKVNLQKASPCASNCISGTSARIWWISVSSFHLPSLGGPDSMDARVFLHSSQLASNDFPQLLREQIAARANSPRNVQESRNRSPPAASKTPNHNPGNHQLGRLQRVLRHSQVQTSCDQGELLMGGGTRRGM